MARIVSSPWVVAVGAITLGFIGLRVRRKQATPFDAAAVAYTGIRERGAERASWFAEPARLIAEAALVAAIVPGLERRERAALVAAPLIAVGVGEVLKSLVPRERPNKNRFTVNGGKSFPSTHTACATAFGLTAAAVACRHGYRKPWTYGLALAFGTWVGLERVRGAAHWPTDVIAGLALGVLSAGVVVRSS